MFKKVFKSLTYNLKTLIKFELIYKMLTVFIFSPVFSFLFKLIMKVTGFKYLTYENILSFIKKPETIIMIIFLLLLMCIYTLFEIITIIVITNASINKVKIKLRDAINASLSKLKFMLFHIRFGLIFTVLFLIPFLNIGIATSYISVIKIPEFIMDFIKSNPLYFTLYIILFILLIYVLLRLIYVINYMVIDKKSYFKSRKESIKLGENKHIKDFIKIITTEALIYLSFLIFIALGIVLILFINKVINSNIVNSILITIIWLYLSISLIMFSLVSVPISYASITYLFYKHKEEKNEEINYIEYNLSKDTLKEKDVINKNRLYKFKFVIYLILILSGSYYTYGIMHGKFNLNINHTYKVELTAHRGLSVKYPENTMLAFKGAKKAGADWIELDVQSTKDNLIIISHDSNLKRTTGVNKNVWELYYNDIRKLDAGNKKYKNVEIPLLEEVIDWAKSNDMKLNIELKPTGYEKDFEKNVVDIIKNNDFEKNCVVTSANYESLKKVKEYYKDIETIYVMSIAYGDILQLNYVDGYSVEAMNVSKSLVKKIHKKDKKIYVWTINNEDAIENMIKYNVDNIITDDIEKAKMVIKENQQTNLIWDYIKFITRVFG